MDPAPPPLPAGTFRIDRDGVWRHEGLEVTHPGVVRNLYANLRAEGTGHHLQVGPVRIPVEVEDAPYVVTRLEAGPGNPIGDLTVHLTDGGVEVLDPASLWIDRRGTPYCRVKGGRFTARLSVAAWLQLAAFVDEEPATGDAWLTIGERRVPLARRGT